MNDSQDIIYLDYKDRIMAKDRRKHQYHPDISATSVGVSLHPNWNRKLQISWREKKAFTFKNVCICKVERTQWRIWSFFHSFTDRVKYILSNSWNYFILISAVKCAKLFFDSSIIILDNIKPFLKLWWNFTSRRRAVLWIHLCKIDSYYKQQHLPGSQSTIKGK